ncbi:MAG: hypothetical protein JRN28_05030 [Nitrososphaerota archaeon]|nr:hypothetical protein [Nitrososphaerota archaeon]
MRDRVAILRWTGMGNAADFQSSVRHVLKERGVKARMRTMGGSIVLAVPEPVGACSIFEGMPGVAWTAAGYAVAGAGDVARASSALAAAYLRRGVRFSVSAEVTGGGMASDLAGAVTSVMLEKVKGARASNEAAKVRFRAARDGKGGVVGVEVARGPGGSPMGSEAVACLVSGGRHSSVLAWDSVLQGLRVNMVHASSGERSLAAAARLYAELSHRADPRGLSLTVLEGGPVPALLSKFAGQCREPMFGGFTVARPAPASLGARVESPLYIMPEEAFGAQFASLGLKGEEEATDWGDSAAGSYSERTFGGRTADVSQVLDGLA